MSPLSPCLLFILVKDSKEDFVQDTIGFCNSEERLSFNLSTIRISGDLQPRNRMENC